MGYKWDPILLATWLDSNEEQVIDWIQQHEVAPDAVVTKIQVGDMYGEVVETDFFGGFTLAVLWSNGHNNVYKVKVDADVTGGRDD